MLSCFRKAKKRKRNKEDKEKNETKQPEDIDTTNHGGWRKAKEISEINGAVAIEFGNNTYLKALDNGLFILGPPHRIGEEPDPQEIFTAVNAGTNKVAFKSGYNKYMKIENDGKITGRSEAIGVMEQWEPIFDKNKMALQSHLGNFMSICPTDDACVAIHTKVTDEEICQIRFKHIFQETDEWKDESSAKGIANNEINEKGDLTETEKAYV